MTTKSGKHANKTSGSAKDKAAKVVDMRKVAALSAGAAGVIAGAAIAFGATPAMAAENPTSAPVNPTTPANEQGVITKKDDSKKTATETTKKDDASKGEDSNKNSVDAKPGVEVPQQTKVEASADSKKSADAKQGVEPKVTAAPIASTESTEENKTGKTESANGENAKADGKSVDNQDAKQDSEETGTPAGSVVNKRTRRSLDEKKQPEPTKDAKAENQDRDASGTESQDPNKIKPNTTDTTNTKIDINENNAGTVPNVYGWGSSDNTYSVDGEKHTITFHFAAPKDGGKITNIAILPSVTNGLDNDRGRRAAEYYSGNDSMHQDYSGTYKLVKNGDGSADLTMSTLFRNGNIGGAEKYAANRSIFVYVTKDNKETIAYKTNAFRAATLVPPKTSGSVVLKYNQPLTAEQVQAAITAAANAATTRSDKMSVNDQIVAASKAKGVFTIVDGKSTQVADTLDGKLNVRSSDAYDKTTFDAINKETSAQGVKDKTYEAGAKTLNTYMVTDLGFKSGAIPLTVARYDTRIDKPIVEDPTKVSAEVKEDIKKKLAKINGVSTDKITFDADGNAVIHFDGVDAKDAPKIKLSDLVLKKLEEKDISVPAADKATVIYNPLAYSDAEIKSIKKAIYEANKDKTELGLSATDYEKQISLSYLTGNLTATGDSNKGISNGQAENIITVKIKTDKAVAEFKSDVKAHKLTRLADIRKDYNVSWTNNKIEDRTTDEGLSWSEDHKTIIYRYDPTKAQEFDTNKILDLLKATPKDPNSGLRDLTGNEKLDHEGVDGKGKKSHVGYVIDKNDQPTTELSLGKMDGAYWKYSRQVDNSGVDLGNEESNAGSYSWDKDAKPVVVAAKQDKVYKARLFVLPYGLTMYRNVYMENGNQPWNTPKAINVIFVPQTNHKKQQLKDSIDKHAVTQDDKKIPTDSAYYNASDDKKAAYDDALKKANDALKEAGDTEDSKLSEELKARIDNATIRLDKARAALDGAKTDKSKLEQDIKDQGNPKKDNTAASGTYKTDKYKNVTEPSFLKDDGKTPDTKKNEAASAAKTAYDEALAAAEKVNKDANATQKAVDDAKAKLDAARKELDKYSTNKDKLNAAIAEHGKVKDGRDAQGAQTLANADPAYQNATEKERTAYDNAVKKANDLSADPNASQKEVNEAITALETAKKALDAKATNKTKLAVAVQQTFDNPDPNDSTKQSTFYKNALGKQTNGSEEEKAKAAAAIKAYDDALKEAKKLLLEDKDGKATQAQVDAAVKALNDAEDKLHDGYSTNKNDLTKALADNIDGYLKPAYFNAFDKSFGAGADAEAAKKAFKEYNDAYHAAKELKAKFANTDPAQQPTDEDCKKAKEALEKARQVIDTYATDTSKLSAAFWNDLAIQNSPAYKNAKALVDKTNPTAEEQAQVAAAKKIKQAYDDAVAKLHKAFSNTFDQDKDAQGTPFAKIPDAKGNPTSKNYLDGVQAHANGEPLDRDVTDILTAMNDAADQLKQFATKTDKLQESINKDTDTQKDPAYKNARDPHKLGTDGLEDTSGYDAIKEKATAYDNALNAAKELMVKPDATQEEVNSALKTLDDARKALDAYKTDVKALEKSVEAQGSTDGPATKEGTVTSDAYRNASDPHFMKEEGGKLVPDKDRNTNAAAAKKAYDEALTKAQELLKKHGDKDTPQDAKPTQKEIDAALTTLNEKRQALDAYKTDTSKLDEEAKKSTAEGATVADADFEAKPEFKNAKAKTSNGVENTDVTAYKKALKDARGLLAKKDSATLSERPTQQQVDEALASLKKAKKQIEDNYKTNLEPLTSAKDFADGDFKKTPEYQNAVAKKGAGDQGATAALGTDGGDTGFDNVLNQIKQKLNDDNWKKTATQKSVNNLLKKLQEAQDKIAKDYKTDAKLLENEVGDKDAQGNDVIPPFEASVPYKNALAKADTEEDKTSDTSATKKLEDYNKKLKAAQELLNKVKNPDPNAKPEDRPTQAQVDAALKALQDAKKAIDDSFGTKIDDLKTEAAKSTADGGTLADTDFEATTEFKNADAKKTDDGKDNADVTAYKEALKKARTLLNKFDDKGKPKPGEKDVPTQKEVDEALKNLKDIKDKITKNYVTSPHDLQEEVDKSKDDKDDTSTDVFENTPEFKNATAKGDEAAKNALDDYNKKLQAAKALLDKFDRTTGKPKQGETAPTQKELDDALDALQAAKKKITDGYKTNKSDLTAEAGKDSDFTKTPEYQNAQAKGDDASKQALEDYKKALEDANKVLGDKNATQAQVDDALKKLQDAKSKLSDGYKTDKSDLTAEAGKDSDFTKSPEYQNAAGSPEADAYKRALDEANRILGDKNATQAQVDAALRKLQDAKKKLADSHKTDKSDLNTEAGKDSDFRKSIPFIIGKAADLAEYQQALNDANSVLKDPNATQAQVDQALRRLRDAKQKLIDSYNRLINSGSGVGSGSDHDFGTDTDVNTGVGVNDVNNTSVNNVVDKGALQAEVDAALGDVSANANGVVADSNLVSEFNAALNYARSVLADTNATQGQVDSALARLRAARAALRAGMLAARNSAGMNLKRGDVSGVNTGASSSVFAAFAAVFAGLGVAGAASKRRKHSAR
ncbi:FIVAR domain-containing protein [Gardnerella sp. DNF00622A]|uniref:peptidase n=1 Tax=Gardnerella sp. DNF00622A TaxID=2749053 RepID=UPI003BB16610